MVEIVERFGRAVRRLRHERGFSQEAFAHRCRVHRTYMGIIERGEKAVTIVTAEKIATALGMDLAELFSELGEREDGPGGV